MLWACELLQLYMACLTKWRICITLYGISSKGNGSVTLARSGSLSSSFAYMARQHIFLIFPFYTVQVIYHSLAPCSAHTSKMFCIISSIYCIRLLKSQDITVDGIFYNTLLYMYRMKILDIECCTLLLHEQTTDMISGTLDIIVSIMTQIMLISY